MGSIVEIMCFSHVLDLTATVWIVLLVEATALHRDQTSALDPVADLDGLTAGC